MPELPEVETTRRGIEKPLLGKRVIDVIVRNSRLRWDIPADLASTLRGKKLLHITRRSKYLLFDFGIGTMVIHLGMSGSLRVLARNTAPTKHDHVDIVFDDDKCLRLRDPRRFGAVLWTASPIDDHPLIKSLGPEPLSDAFSGEYLYKLTRNKTTNIKNVIMNAHHVVGVGNIYASEALFYAHIKPNRKANKLSHLQAEALVDSIRQVLKKAIAAGGTTLQDFVQVDGKPGYFSQQLAVYGRAHEPCHVCGKPIRSLTIGGRNTFYCNHCQK